MQFIHVCLILLLYYAYITLTCIPLPVKYTYMYSTLLYSYRIGAGTFGTVKKGIYRPKSGERAIECALKCLKPTEELPNQKAEILREADAMANLDHPNIVRLVGKED